MTLTDAQVSRLTAALNNQLEADKQFAAKTKAILDSTTSGSLLQADERRDAGAPDVLAPPLFPSSSAPTAALELEKQLEAKSPELDLGHPEHMQAQLNPSSATTSPRAAVSPPLVPQSFEDRYAKGWADAWDFVRPQLHELHRRYILTATRLSSANRWIKWLPIICFLCTLFGFTLGWCWGTLVTSRSWNAAQTREIIPKGTDESRHAP